ncbi:MAG: universal stress protein [Proteobacteria bacterium]|nr:universal stress protein [Pseudomonadota bacterium]
MNILVCYNDSSAAQDALNLSIQHAKRFNAKVYVITSLVGGTKDNIEDNKKAENGLNYAVTTLEKEGISTESHLLVRGMSSGEDIVQFANENEIDEIIIGIKKTSKVGKLLFGSTAQFVILEADCPVVTVK